MPTQTDPVSVLKRRIVRSQARLDKWDQEVAAIEPWWLGGPAYKQFCDQLAGAARQKNAALEAELKYHHAELQSII